MRHTVAAAIGAIGPGLALCYSSAMASVTTSIRSRKPHKRRFPFDAVGALALAWAVGFLALAFALGAWLG